jgi:hypothetical protein
VLERLDKGLQELTRDEYPSFGATRVCLRYLNAIVFSIEIDLREAALRKGNHKFSLVQVPWKGWPQRPGRTLSGAHDFPVSGTSMVIIAIQRVKPVKLPLAYLLGRRRKKRRPGRFQFFRRMDFLSFRDTSTAPCGTALKFGI